LHGRDDRAMLAPVTLDEAFEELDKLAEELSPAAQRLAVAAA
jgi:hypothetical protein